MLREEITAEYEKYYRSRYDTSTTSPPTSSTPPPTTTASMSKSIALGFFGGGVLCITIIGITLIMRRACNRCAASISFIRNRIEGACQLDERSGTTFLANEEARSGLVRSTTEDPVLYAFLFVD